MPDSTRLIKTSLKIALSFFWLCLVPLSHVFPCPNINFLFLFLIFLMWTAHCGPSLFNHLRSIFQIIQFLYMLQLLLDGTTHPFEVEHLNLFFLLAVIVSECRYCFRECRYCCRSYFVFVSFFSINPFSSFSQSTHFIIFQSSCSKRNSHRQDSNLQPHPRSKTKN